MPQDDAISMIEPQQDMDVASNDSPPVSPANTPRDVQSSDDALNVLRRYHLGEPGAVSSTVKIADDVLPALLSAYRNGRNIRFDYPLYLPPIDAIENDLLSQPLGNFLDSLVMAFAPEDSSARMLKDNIPFIERHIRRATETSTEPVEARQLVSEAGVALQDQIDLEAEHRDTLQQDLDRMLEEVVRGGRFLSYGPFVALHLFEQAVEHFTHVQRTQFQNEVGRRIAKLQDMVVVEDEKAVDGNQPDAVEQRVGSAASYFDSSALSGILKHKKQGSVDMPEDRRARIEGVIETLQESAGNFTSIQYVCLEASPWDTDVHGFELLLDADPCTRASQLYEEQAKHYASIFAAYRTAELEINDTYEPAVHDSWFDNFDWEAFSAEELQLVPVTIALATCNHLATAGMQPLSRLLSSRRPVHVLAWVQAHTNPGNLDPNQTDYRTELAYLGIGHRQVNVAQTSASRYEHLISGYLRSLENSRSSLHLINSEHIRGPVSSTLNPWMMASAALESRAHPFVQVRPGNPGEPVENVDFTGNPSPETDWSVSEFTYLEESGETVTENLAFTYVDYCLLKPTRFDNFRLVPQGCDSDDLVDVVTYLSAESTDVDRMIPFVRGVDADGKLQKLVVSRRLMLECRDRLSFWQALQALAGVRNHYVDRVRAEVIEEQNVANEKEKAELISAHEEALSLAESDAATRVLGRLADVLVGLDLVNTTGVSPAVAASPVASEPEPEEEDSAAAEELADDAPESEEEEDDISFDEPYIDSLMCTTCDDCMSINKMLFIYNDDKQAIITDPKAGTYAHMVEAAEKCPARCIHPGKPQNPDEPGLDELIQRAEAYN